MKIIHSLLAILFFSLTISLPVTAGGLWVHHSVEEEFDTIKEYIEEGITNQGLVVAHRSDVGGMLERTGKDMVSRVQDIAHTMVSKAKRKIGMAGESGQRTTAASATFARSEIIEFCSANLSRKMTDADPANVIFCPYSIAIYTTTDEPGVVHVSYLQLSKIGSTKSHDVLKEVEAMLEQIVSEATE